MVDPAAAHCPWSDRCAGCPLLSMPYERQLARKRQRVLGALRRYRSLEHLMVEPVVPASPMLGYRTRAKLMVAPGPRIGLYAKGEDHVVVDIPGCPVLAPELDEITRALRALVASAPSDAATALTPYGDGGALSALDLRLVVDPDSGEKGVLVTLVLDRDRAPSAGRIESAAEAVHEAVPNVLGIAVNLHSAHSPQVLGPATRVVWGAISAPDRVGRAYQLASHGAFVQVHPGQAEAVRLLIDDALRARGVLPGGRVIDAYGGSGAIALDLARAGADVTLIESFAPAVENAKRAAREQGLAPGPDRAGRVGTLRARTGDAGEILEALAEQHATVHALIVNPPRRGVGPRARRAIAKLRPNVVLYVSCSPDTLARDLDHFARLGLVCSMFRPFDMIPLSDHVESVALLEPAGTTPAEIVDGDRRLLWAVKAPHEPLTRQPGHPVSLLDRVAAARPGARFAPLTALEVGASGLVVLAVDPPRTGGKTLGAAEGIRCAHIALVRGTVRPRGTLLVAQHGGRRQRLPYRRLERIGAHSLVEIEADAAPIEALRRALARSGHPVLGDDDAGHAPTNRHLEERHGLDRIFWHCARIESAGGRVTACPLAADLEVVAASLRAQGAG